MICTFSNQFLLLIKYASSLIRVSMTGRFFDIECLLHRQNAGIWAILGRHCNRFIGIEGRQSS